MMPLEIAQPIVVPAHPVLQESRASRCFNACRGIGRGFWQAPWKNSYDRTFTPMTVAEAVTSFGMGIGCLYFKVFSPGLLAANEIYAFVKSFHNKLEGWERVGKFAANQLMSAAVVTISFSIIYFPLAPYTNSR